MFILRNRKLSDAWRASSIIFVCLVVHILSTFTYLLNSFTNSPKYVSQIIHHRLFKTTLLTVAAQASALLSIQFFFLNVHYQDYVILYFMAFSIYIFTILYITALFTYDDKYYEYTYWAVCDGIPALHS